MKATENSLDARPYVMRLFSDWVSFYKPDHVSKIVLSSLLNEYISGNKDALFGKFNQLIESELYQLCVIFRDCFYYIGLNDEFKHWQLTPNVMQPYFSAGLIALNHIKSTEL